MKIHKILFLFLLVNANSIFAQTNKNYFEGSIEYRISYVSYMDGITADQLSALKGEKMVYTVKTGNTSKEYFNEQHVLIEKRVFLPKSCKNIQWLLGKDSLFEFNPSKNNFNTISYKILPDTIIDELVLKGVEVVVKDKRDTSKPEIRYTYYFYDQLYADPSWYSCYKDGDWNRVMKQMKSFCYWYKIETPGFYSAVFKSIRVNRDPVGDAVFQLPTCSHTIKLD